MQLSFSCKSDTGSARYLYFSTSDFGLKHFPLPLESFSNIFWVSVFVVVHVKTHFVLAVEMVIAVFLT